MCKTIKLELCTEPEYTDSPLPKEITAELSKEALAAIGKAQDFLKSNPEMWSVNINIDPDISEKVASEISDALDYDVSYISVFNMGGLYWYFQSKHNCRLQVEYEIGDFDCGR